MSVQQLYFKHDLDFDVSNSLAVWNSTGCFY